MGFALIAGSTLQLLFALQFGGHDFAWGSPTIIGLFIGSGLAFILFCFWNSRMGDDGLVPFSIAKQRLVWSSSLTMSALTGTMFVASYFLPLYFQAVLDASPAMSGVYMLPSILGQLVFAGAAGFMGKNNEDSVSHALKSR